VDDVRIRARSWKSMSDGSAEAVRDAVRGQLADPRAGWSVGTWGAVADIEHGRCEPVVLDGLSARSPRAAIRLDRLDWVRLVAYERCLRWAGSWRQALALRVATDAGRRRSRRVVAALGSDHEAVANDHQELPLFDLGLGTAYADFCVRTHRPPLIGALMVVPTARSTSSFRVRR
jgi:hypothetical protein